MQKWGTNMLNNATTSSVVTKLSISGWTWRSMYNRRSGKIVIGPSASMSRAQRIGGGDVPGLK